MRGIPASTIGAAMVQELRDLMSWGDCSSKQIPSKPISDRCLPGDGASNTETDKQKEAVAGLGNSTVDQSVGFREIMADLQQTWALIFVMLLFASLFSIVWVFLMRYIGGKLVWVLFLQIIIFANFVLYKSLYNSQVNYK